MPLKPLATICFVFVAALTLTSTGAKAQNERKAIYGRLLKTYVAPSPSGINLVDYASWQRNARDRAALKTYLELLQKQKPSAMPRKEAYVFWVNLYNAATLNIVLQNYPVNSIRDIKSEGTGLFDFKSFLGPWRTKLVNIEGKRLSLDDIEHKIVRPQFKDPRTHYALNCASLGCPNLKLTPWSAETLEADLDAAAKDFINHPRGVRIGLDGKLIVSSIYEWFEEDFGGSQKGVIGHLRQYAKPELAKKLERRTKIDGDNYNWSLNQSGEGRAVR